MQRFLKRILKKRSVLLLAGVAALLVIALIVLLPGGGKEVPVADVDAATVIDVTAAPTPTPSPTPAVPTPSPTPAKPKAEGYLVLVNWEHRNPRTEAPDDLATLGEVFGDEVYYKRPKAEVNRVAGEAASEMFKQARSEGICRYRISGAYRTVSYQWELFNVRYNKDKTYGSDPYNNPVKTLPGDVSEHTTGLAIDILSDDHPTANDAYADTPEGIWLAENAYKYGFILRYPKGKEHITGVIFEPWHYRYVGVEAAAEIYARGICLEEYVDADF